MDMPDIGLREILVIAVAATAAYLLLSLLRLVQIARKKTRPRAESFVVPTLQRSEPRGEMGAAANEAITLIEPPAPPSEPQAEEPQAQEAPPPKPPLSWLPRWLKSYAQVDTEVGEALRAAEAEESFGDRLLRTTLEAEMQHLRSDVAGLREELKLVKAARRVSPQYNEAMMLAQRGIDAQGIAEQCGISVGEAELVLALSRNKQEYGNYGENDARRSAG